MATARPLNKTMSDPGFGPLFVYETYANLNQDATNAAGTYTMTVKVPAYAEIMDIVIEGVALWNAGTSALMDVGDDDDPNGFYAAVNLKATDLLADESLSFYLAGGKGGAYVTATQVTNRRSTSDRTISAVITTVGTPSTTGETRMIVQLAYPFGGNMAVPSTYAAT